VNSGTSPLDPCVHLDEQAPAFTLPAYYLGREIQVALSDFFGTWLLMIFYPSDFTFV
jgi:alkyl hydroperoxide reductase subunit AhpC